MTEKCDEWLQGHAKLTVSFACGLCVVCVVRLVCVCVCVCVCVSYAVRMFEKLIWICSFMVVGASHGGCTVGEVCQEHRPQLAAVVDELAALCAATQGVVFGPNLTERLCSYGMSVAHFPTAVKELQWRNGFFYNLSQSAIAQGKDDPAPLHSELLKAMNVLA